MCSTSIFPCIMTMVSNFTIFFIFHTFIFKFSFTNVADFWYFYMIPSALLLITFSNLKLIIFNECSLKDSQNFSMQSLPLYTSCLFSMLLNVDIVDIENPDGIYWLTFAVDEFSGLFLHPSTFSIILSRSA